MDCCVNKTANHTLQGPASKSRVTPCTGGVSGNCYLLAPLSTSPHPDSPQTLSSPCQSPGLSSFKKLFGALSAGQCVECEWHSRVCVSSDCHNKLPPTGWLKTTEIHSLILEARSLKPTSKAASPPKALGENPSLLLPASGGCKCFLPCGCITQSLPPSTHGLHFVGLQSPSAFL